MMQLSVIRLLVSIALLAPLALRAVAQDDFSEAPLGDVARTLRKKTPPSKPVIDDDNLPQVVEQADSPHEPGHGLRFLMSGSTRSFQVQAPDVTCSLSFTAGAKSLLSSQFDQMELPPAELAKIEGKAVVEGDALTIPVFNGTQWHLSEITVAFTVVKEGRAASRADQELSKAGPEKKPDLTMIYRMRAAALPWSNGVFSAPLNLEVAPGEEWHWAIVQAKGYPPETYVSATALVQNDLTSRESVPQASSAAQGSAPPASAQVRP